MSKKSNDPSLQSTKQMLDELDALMEKMLALPVNELDESAQPFPKEVVKAPAVKASLTLLETPPPVVEAKQDSPIPGVQPPHMQPPPPIVPLTPLVESAPIAHSQHALQAPHVELAPPPAPTPLANEVVPPTIMPALEKMLAEVPAPEPPPTTYWLFMPLLWANQLFDACTGDWFAGPAARAMLGVFGFAFLLVSASWFLKDWLGWNW